MNIQQNMMGIAKGAAIGAAAGTFVGPLGTAGGAAAGAIHAVALKSAESLYKSYGPSLDKEDAVHAVALPPLIAAAFLGPVYAAGALINTPVTLLGAAAHYAGELGASFIIKKTGDCAKEIFDDFVTEIKKELEQL